MVSPRTVSEPLVPPLTVESALSDDGRDLKAIGRRAAIQAERGALREALDSVRWNRREAARLLNVSYRTLRRKLQERGLLD